MDLFVIRGGRALSGRVAVGGSKNAALPILAASLMIDGPATLHGVPDLADVATLCQVLRSLGTVVERRPARDREEADAVAGAAKPQAVGDGGAALVGSRADDAGGTTLVLRVADGGPCVAAYNLVRRMRASVCVLGPLLARRGRAVVSLPGGCNIGDRPIDVHLRGLAALGADLRLERGYVVATAGRLRGAQIDLLGPRGTTVTGTANVLAAATLAAGVTVLRHAAREPEIADLAAFLNAAGARIEGVGSDTVVIRGVDDDRAVCGGLFLAQEAFELDPSIASVGVDLALGERVRSVKLR